MPLNTTTSTASTTALNKDYYDRKLLETAKTKFVHQQFGQKRPIPKNEGKTVRFRRYNLFTPDIATQTLTEGVTPESQALSQSEVTATVAQYGAYVAISDMLDLTAIDPVIKDSTELLGEQLGTVVDWATRDAMRAGASVHYVGGGTATNQIAAEHVMTIAEIRKAVKTLKKAKARPFSDGTFVCIVDPDVSYDIQNDELWKQLAIHADPERAWKGEIGRLFGVTFVETTEGFVEDGAGSGGAAVHHSMLFGADAYGVIDIAGSSAIKSIIKPHGSGEDPLDQRATVGAKVTAYAAKVLNSLWIIDIQSAAS